MTDGLVYAGALILVLWGGAHLVMTRPIVDGFGPLSPDNRRVLTMEWILEGVTLCFVAVLVSTMTAIYGGQAAWAAVLRLAAALLVVMAVVSLLTGARAGALPYKLCPPIFTTAAVLFVIASLR